MARYLKRHVNWVPFSFHNFCITEFETRLSLCLTLWDLFGTFLRVLKTGLVTASSQPGVGLGKFVASSTCFHPSVTCLEL